jgi:hypothetical protein
MALWLSAIDASTFSIQIIFVRACVDPRATERPEGLRQLKNPTISSRHKEERLEATKNDSSKYVRKKMPVIDQNSNTWNNCQIVSTVMGSQSDFSFGSTNTNKKEKSGNTFS